MRLWVKAKEKDGTGCMWNVFDEKTLHTVILMSSRAYRIYIGSLDDVNEQWEGTPYQARKWAGLP